MTESQLLSIPGIRSAVKGLTPYQPGTFIEEVQDQFGLDRVIKIASNENPYGPYPRSIERMEDEVKKLNQYPDVNFKSLRDTLGRIHDVPPECICLSHGAEGMLQTIGKTFLDPGDEVVIPGATYTLYREISKVMGAKVVTAAMDDVQVSLAAIGEQVTPTTKLIWLANPNNPTGTVVNPDAFSALLDRLPEHTWVILDEAYAEFADSEMLPDRGSLICANRHVISVRTFSKAYGMAGARLGYAIAPAGVITALNTVSEPFNANRIAIAGAIAAITEDLDYADQVLEKIKNERSSTQSKLEKIGLRVVPSQANFIMFETPFPAMDIYDAFLKSAIIVRPCNAWGYDRMIRVSIGTEAEMTCFISALERILHDLGVSPPVQEKIPV